MINLEGDQADMHPHTPVDNARAQNVETLVSSVQRMSEQRLNARQKNNEQKVSTSYENQLTVLFQAMVLYSCMSNSIVDVEAEVQRAIETNKDPLVVLLHKIAEVRQLSIEVAEEGSLEIADDQLVLSLGLWDTFSTVSQIQKELVDELAQDVKQAFAALKM